MKESVSDKSTFVLLFVTLVFLCGYIGFLSKYDSLTMYNYEKVNEVNIGWAEYIDSVYNDTNRITIGNSLVNFTMQNYTIHYLELPDNITNETWFNGSHIHTDKTGSSFLYRWRYKAEPQFGNTYCQFFYNIGGSVGQLPMRTITFPKGQNVEQIGAFTNFEYTLNTWEENGAYIQAICSNDVEFWDIALTIQKLYTGRGTYT